jgi:hypothetical protein
VPSVSGIHSGAEFGTNSSAEQGPEAAAPSDRCVEVRRAIVGPEPIGRRRSPVRPGCASGRARLVIREPHESNGHGDVVRLPARGFFEGYDQASRGVRAARSSGSSGVKAAYRNAANPRIGSGMQQARDLRGRQTVEVVRNHEGGNRSGSGDPGPRPVATPAVTRSRRDTMEGRTGESQERRSATPDFGPVEPARAERRLRRGGEGHGGADVRVTERASAVGVPRRPVPGGAGGSALSTAIRTEQRPGRGRGRPTTRYCGLVGLTEPESIEFRFPCACTGRDPRAPEATPTSRKPLGRSREISGNPRCISNL